MAVEIKPRVVHEVDIHYCTYVPLRWCEQPLPAGLYGIKFPDDYKENIEILDQEVVIFGRSPAGAESAKLPLATMSIDEAKKLPEQLKKAIQASYELALQVVPGIVEGRYSLPRLLARILHEPQIMVANLDLELVERPLSEGVYGKFFPIVVTTEARSGVRVPNLMMGVMDAVRLAGGIEEIIASGHCSGKGRIDIERQYFRERLIEL